MSEAAARVSPPLRVLVVDDEPPARRRLMRLIDRIEGCVSAGEASNGEEALARIREVGPDVVLLDIRMPGLSGLELAKRAEALPPVIFTTAYDEYAVEAFEANAVDYLLKPVQPARLEAALAKVPRRDAEIESARLGALLERMLERDPAAVRPRVTARSGRTIRVFDPRAIRRFTASDRYAIFRLENEEFLLDESLSSLERRLETAGFLRVHRSELVNLEHVQALELEDGASEIVLDDGQRAPVSRRLLPEVKRRLGVSESGSA